MRTPALMTEMPEEKETILVLEDNDLVRRFTVRMLRTAGYRIREAATEEDAVAELDGVDLLLSDVTISGHMIGATLARTARRANGHLKVLLTTGHTAETLSYEGIEPEEFTILYKPYTKQQLLANVRLALDSEQKPNPAAPHTTDGVGKATS
jgi:DNA-binding response OmpR family regulator